MILLEELELLSPPFLACGGLPHIIAIEGAAPFLNLKLLSPDPPSESLRPLIRVLLLSYFFSIKSLKND